MNRTMAPMSAKVFAGISAVLTALALVVCLGIIFLQGMLKGVYSASPEIHEAFVFPVISFLVRFAPALVSAALCLSLIHI